MEKLQIIDSLRHLEEIEACTLAGDLVCACGNDFFSIYYFGKQTRGILAPDIVRKHGTLFIAGQCSICGKTITIYDSDSLNPPKRQAKPNPPDGDGRPLARFGSHPYKIKVLFNYLPQNMRSIHFEDIFIEVRQADADKWKRIVEE